MASWNCCGLGNPATVLRLREIHKVNSPDVIFLMETKNPDSVVLEKLQFLRSFQNLPLAERPIRPEAFREFPVLERQKELPPGALQA